MSRRAPGPCGYCLNPISSEAARHGRTRFCSRRCFGLSKRVGNAVPVLYVACRECQGVMVMGPKRKAATCSLRCRRAEIARLTKERYWTPTPERTYRCETCAQVFTRSGRHGSPRFCSGPCQERGPVAKAGNRRRASRRRARLRGVEFMAIDHDAVFARDKGRCQLCGDRIAKGVTVPHPKAPTLDHIVPLAKGGAHVYSNVQLAHFICNSRKGAGGYVAPKVRRVANAPIPVTPADMEFLTGYLDAFEKYLQLRLRERAESRGLLS